MKTNQGIKTHERHGAECSVCGDWIGKGAECVVFQPAEIDRKGSALNYTPQVVHGAVHLNCFKNL